MHTKLQQFTAIWPSSHIRNNSNLIRTILNLRFENESNCPRGPPEEVLNLTVSPRTGADPAAETSCFILPLPQNDTDFIEQIILN